MNTWISLIPPIIVLATSFLTKRIVLSLFLGIFSAALIATNFSIINTLYLSLDHFLSQFKEVDTYYLFGLIFVIGILIALISKTGGAQALGNLITKKSKDKKAAETSSLILSMMLPIDDYLSSLTVGHVMRTLTDKFRIPRVKLAYLISIMATSLVIIIPISSWVGVIVTQLSKDGISLSPNSLISADPFFAYLKSIPYIFYSFIMIAATWFIVRARISFGLISKQEKIAEETGNLFGGKEPVESKLENVETSNQRDIIYLILPIAVYIFCILIGLPYMGGYYLFGGTNSFIQSLQKTNATIVLFLSSIVSLIIMTGFSLITKKINFQEIPNQIKTGIEVTIPAVLVILLSWVFGDFLKLDLKTGNQLANLLSSSLSIEFLPLMTFLTSSIVALAIGSSWGTIFIMIPIIIPMIISISHTQMLTDISSLNIIFPCLGAVFSGSIAGNQLSPISDSTILASTSSSAYMIDLIKGRIYYILPSFIAAAIAFLISGFMISKSYYLTFIISILAGLIISLASLSLINFLYKKS